MSKVIINDNPVDKNGIPIEEGDTLKVFHFIGARRKKYYMYKSVVKYKGRLYGAHLGKPILRPDFPLWCGFNSELYEIVQSNNWEKL